MNVSDIVSVLLLAIFVDHCQATLYPSDRRVEKKIIPKVGAVGSSVRERGLVVPKPTAQQLLVENEAYFRHTGVTSFSGAVLGYVTPWNNHGYDVAKIFGGKFSLISPVWFQMQINASNEYEVKGLHNHDANWMKDVRRKSGADSKIKVVPMLKFENWSTSIIAELLSFANKWKEFVHMLTNIAQVNKYNGYVLELWEELGDQEHEMLTNFVSYLCESLHKSSLLCILTVPVATTTRKEIFDKEDFDALEEDVDAFSLSTYDFSPMERPGPNAPIGWIRGCVEKLVPCLNGTSAEEDCVQKRAKVLIGLNWYGNEYTIEGGGTIKGPDFVKLLTNALARRKTPRVTYDSESEETFFEIRTKEGKHTVFYPTLWSIEQRIKMAKEMGCGLALWETGMGMNYFYDLL